MHKRIKCLAAVLTLSMVMTGCQSGGENVAKKDYNALDYVTLGEYKGLEVEQVEEKKELTAEEKEEALTEILESYAEEKDITDRGAANGDYLSIAYKCYEDGELVDESGDEDAVMQLGTYTYFDEEGEAQLIGCKAGDTKTVELTEDDGENEYKYTYEVTVNRVYESILPELDDAIAAEEGYDSAQAMETAVYQDALASFNEDYISSAKEQLVQMVISNSETNGYPQPLYDQTYEQLNEAYMDFFGVSIDEIYEGDEESLKEAVEDMLIQELVVEALAEQEKITVTSKELGEYKESVVQLYGYTDVSELEAEYPDQVMAESLLNEKVMDFLMYKAKVTYVTEEEYYGYTDEEWGLSEDIVDEDVLDDEA